MHEHVNIHILRSLLWDYVHTAVCEKCIVRIEESVRGGRGNLSSGLSQPGGKSC